MATYVIEVPKIGPYMSANDRPNRWAKAAQTKAWRSAGYMAALKAIPKLKRGHPDVGQEVLKGLVRITATVHIADKRRREVSNYFPTFKACVDGFVDAGILADDSDAHVIGPDPRRAYDLPPRITFTLEEVAGV